MTKFRYWQDGPNGKWFIENYVSGNWLPYPFTTSMFNSEKECKNLIDEIRSIEQEAKARQKHKEKTMVIVDI